VTNRQNFARLVLAFSQIKTTTNASRLPYGNLRVQHWTVNRTTVQNYSNLTSKPILQTTKFPNFGSHLLQ